MHSVVKMIEKTTFRIAYHADRVDPLTGKVIRDSMIDAVPAAEWIASDRPRPARQACLLNILAKARVPAAPEMGIADPLSRFLKFVYRADVDRAYAVCSKELPGILERLCELGWWVAEGTPKAAIHGLLLDSLTSLQVPEDVANRFELRSYRQGGVKCLQFVVAVPPSDYDQSTVYADIDIDLGNPLWDLEGIVIHLGELLDSGKTDHMKLRAALSGTAESEFLYYDLVKASEAYA